MRRFIAFIMLAVSVLLGLGFSTPSMMKNANLSLDYTSGKEFVYSVERKAADDDTTIRDNEMNELANILSTRLDNAGISRYQVILESNESVRVQVSTDYDNKYEHLKRLMAFDADFTLATSDSEQSLSGEVAFGNNKARVDFKGAQAYFVIPLEDGVTKLDDFKNLVSHASSLSGGEDDTSNTGKILLWSDFDSEVDTLAKSQETGNEEMANRILCSFDPNNLYFDEDASEIAVAVQNNSDSVNYALSADLAKTYVDLFNAKTINLKLTFMFEQYVEPLAEEFINYGKPLTLAFSRTLIALIVALILVSVFMIVFYKLEGLNAVINMLVSLFFTFALFNAVGMTFNVGALVGLVVVAMLSLVTSIIYIEALKNEIYRGRSLKKANQEANKRTFITAIDTHLVILLASLVTYFVGHSAIQSLAILGVVGSLISFLAYITLNRLMTWLLANDTSLQTNYKLFGIKKEAIPDISKEEKQTYYGPFEKVDFTKKAKRNSLGIGIASAVFALAMLGFGLFGNGVVNNSKGVDFTRAYYSLNEYGETIRDNDKNISIEYFEENLTDALKEKGIKINDIKSYEGTTNDDADETIYYYVIDFKGVVSKDTKVAINSENETLEEYMLSIINPDASEVTDLLSIREVRQVGTNPIIKVTQPSLTNVIIATAIVAVISALYITIRFGLARGLVTLGANVLTTFLPLGFFALTRITVLPATFVSLIAVTLINTLFVIIHATKAKEVLAEKKNEDVSILDNSVRALSLSAAPLFAGSIIASYLALDLLAFGAPAFNTTFVAMLLGLLVSLMINLTLFVPVQLFLEKHVGSINIRLPKRQAKAKKKSGNLKGENRSNEPEEALYPGIND